MYTQIKTRSGRIGQEQEYTEFRFSKHAAIVAQKSGRHWVVLYVVGGTKGHSFVPKGQTDFSKAGATKFARQIAEKAMRGDYVGAE